MEAVSEARAETSSAAPPTRTASQHELSQFAALIRVLMGNLTCHSIYESKRKKIWMVLKTIGKPMKSPIAEYADRELRKEARRVRRNLTREFKSGPSFVSVAQRNAINTIFSKMRSKLLSVEGVEVVKLRREPSVYAKILQAIRKAVPEGVKHSAIVTPDKQTVVGVDSQEQVDEIQERLSKALSELKISWSVKVEFRPSGALLTPI